MQQLSFSFQDGVLSVSFHWDGRKKPVSTMFVGTSAEYEMAVYTLCFVVRPDKGCWIGVGTGNATVNIQTFAMTRQLVHTISTAFPRC